MIGTAAAKRLDELITPHLPRLRELRHELHRFPEIAHEETRTIALVKRVLTDQGLPSESCTPTGLVCDLGGGSRDGVTVALRADVDGLPMNDMADHDHRSQLPDRMHACGHDGHTAILLGAAAVLAPIQERLGPNRVRLIFQPAEEEASGAPAMIDAGVLGGVHRIYGLHNWPAFDLGTVVVAEGPVMAASGNFFVTLTGRSGHGSQPHLTRDPIVTAAHVINHLQTIVSREGDPREPQVVSVCTIHGGGAENIIPDEVRLTGTIRTLSDDTLDDLGRQVGDRVTAVGQAGGCHVDYRYVRHTPTLKNHPVETALVEEIGRELLGQDGVTRQGLPLLGAEDFAFYVQHRRGAYFFLGGGRPGESAAMCHSSRYDFNDDLLLPGISMFLRIIEKELGCRLA